MHLLEEVSIIALYHTSPIHGYGLRAADMAPAEVLSAVARVTIARVVFAHVLTVKTIEHAL